jgi:dolichol-phosphate mannosyltransferase
VLGMQTEMRMRPNELRPSIAGGPATMWPAETRPVAAGRLDAAPAALQLSIVVPTFNERQNVREFIARLEVALRGISWELIFVDDDSPDGTSAEVKAIAVRDSRIRCLRRIGRRGLSSACIEGMLAAAAPTLVVMDADLQHDETKIPAMLEALESHNAQLVIASRYTAGGGVGEWDKTRAYMSRLATRLSRLVCRQEISDPMSGFFMIRADALERCVHDLSGKGFKILLDIVASTRDGLCVAEVPYSFRERLHGESKLDSLVVWDFGMLLAEKTIGKYIPVRFVAFTLVGGAGVLVHMAILAALRMTQMSFTTAQGVATIVAMVFNFWLNNLLTYRDRRLRGTRWLTGLLSFMLACGLGAVANVGIASYLFKSNAQWVVAALAGIAVGAVWNYAITQLYTWGHVRARDNR